MNVRPLFLTFSAALALLALSSGCGGGLYGYSRSYEPLGDEEDYFQTSQIPAYADVRRDPADFQSATLNWFGVVKDVRRQGNRMAITLSHRAHWSRHLCADREEETCRVTVQERSEGDFTVIVDLRSDDAGGANRVQVNSLLRVYGRPNGDYDASGGPVVDTVYYRHWPRGQYVTTAARGSMRQ